jgi:hypothetical protein
MRSSFSFNNDKRSGEKAIALGNLFKFVWIKKGVESEYEYIEF